MRSVADDLQQVRFLSHISLSQIRTAATFFNGFDLEPGEALWREGDPALELAVLVSGELLATTRGVEVGRIHSNEVVGEASVFLGSRQRSATLGALEGCRVVTLQVTGLRRLRDMGSPVYECLLSQALCLQVRRIRATDLRIARVALGDRPAPTRREASVLARMWRALRPGGPSVPCPALEPLLRALPLLEVAPQSVIDELAPLFAAQAVEEGEILCLEGEPGAAAFLIADGHIDVLRHVRGERAENLATLGPGDLIGVNTLVERGNRTASCVAAEAGWVYRIQAEHFDSPTGLTRRTWHESVLATLSTQLQSANAVLNRVTDPLGEADEISESGDLEKLMRASSLLEALPSLNTADVERVRVLPDP